MSSFRAAFDSFDRVVSLLLEFMCIVLFALLTLLLTTSIVVRFVPIMSMHWFDEIVELVFAALVFYGAAALWIVKGHFSVGDWISTHIMQPRLRHAYRLLVELGSLLFMAIFLKYAWEITVRAQDVTNALQMPKALLYSCMPIAAAVMLVYTLKNVAIEIAGIVEAE